MRFSRHLFPIVACSFAGLMVCGQAYPLLNPVNCPFWDPHQCGSSTPPAPPPFAPLLALGDAVTLGGAISPTYPATVGTDLGVTAVNVGLDGGTMAQIKAIYDATWHRTGGSGQCLLQGGAQDIIKNGASAASTYTTASALLDEMRSDGCKPAVVITTPTKFATGWTAPRQSEWGIYRNSLIAYCTAHLAQTSCIDTYHALGNGDVMPELGSSFDTGDHLNLTQTGANTLAATAYYGLTSGTPLYNSNTADVTTTTPVAVDGGIYCLTATEVPNPHWSDHSAAGLISFGVFNHANSVNLYRTGSAGSAGDWTVWYFDVSNTSTTFSSNGVTFPDGYAAYSRHRVALCANAGAGTFWVDGINVTSHSIPTNIAVNGAMFTGANGFGGASNTITNICIAGPTGVSNTDVRAAVQNSCGQFTPYFNFPVEGGQNAASGANVVVALGDSITQFGGSAVRPYPQKLNTLLGSSYNVINEGHSGNTVANIKAIYDATYHGHGAIDRCVLLIGIVDIFSFGSTAASTYTTASALLDEMRSDGCRPIVVLPTPAKNTTLGWSSGKQTAYDAYRADLAAYCVTNSATTTCVDTYGAGPSSGLGDGTSPPQLYSAYDNGDHTHPAQAGLDELASLVFAGATWP